MDIEEYIKRKRELEAKKDILEGKEHLKEEREKKKQELEKEKKRVFKHEERASHSGEHHEHAPEQQHPFNMYKKILMWNMLLLFLVFSLFAVAYFFPRYGKEQIETIAGLSNTLATQSNTSEAPVVSEENVSSNATSPQDGQGNATGVVPEKYPGPEFALYLEDEELGSFDESGKIGGENLVITSKYYNDGIIHLDNKEKNVIICYIDRHTTVDENRDGKIDLEDFDLDFIVEELDPLEKFTWKDSLPGEFKDGTYSGYGKTTAEYEARCYYCIDKFCSEGGDKNGESVGSAKLKFDAKSDG